MKRFLSADYHFNHTNVLDFEKRPFKNISHMNSEIIRKHNERVKSEDEMYFEGDFLFGGKPNDFLKQMNGHWHFVAGNHDGNNKLKVKTEQMILRIGGIKLQLLHNPEYASVDNQLILCGHVHSRYKVKELKYCGKKSLIINVGVDVWNYYPVSWDEIQGIYLRWEKGASVSSLNKWRKNGS